MHRLRTRVVDKVLSAFTAQAVPATGGTVPRVIAVTLG